MIVSTMSPVNHPAYIPGLSAAALTAVKHGADIQWAIAVDKKTTQLAVALDGTIHTVEVGKHNFPSAAKKMTVKLGGDPVNVPGQAAVTAYKLPIFRALVTEVVSHGGKIVGHEFEGKTAILHFNTGEGTATQTVSTRPQTRLRALKEVVAAFTEN